MRNVEPKAYLIAQSQIGAIDKWLEDLGVSLERRDELCSDMTKTDGEQIVEMAGRRCYMSFEPKLNPNVTRIREDIAEYLENLLKSRHGSVLEHVSYTFALENVSRVFTAEMNRHRAGVAISEGSMRYIRFTDIPFWMPHSIRAETKLATQEGIECLEHMRSNGGGKYTVDQKKCMSQAIFEEAFGNAERLYKELLYIWGDELADNSTFALKKEITSMMRRIIPIGVASGGIWTGNLRALRHILTMRCDESAEEEIRHVAVLMFEILIEKEPNFFGDFQKNAKGYLEPKYRKV